MSEKIKAFFQNETVRSFNKRVFNKKTLTLAIAIIVLGVALKIGFLLTFEVQGTVQKVEGSQITVANFLTTKTIDVGSYPITSIGIQAGDRIEILKNLSGQVIEIKDRNRGHMKGKEKANFSDHHDSKNNDRHNSKGKH